MAGKGCKASHSAATCGKGHPNHSKTRDITMALLDTVSRRHCKIWAGEMAFLRCTTAENTADAYSWVWGKCCRNWCFGGDTAHAHVESGRKKVSVPSYIF